MSLCILTNADAGIQRAGQVVRMVGSTALLALADTSPHSTDLVGVRLSDVNPGVGGYVAPFMSGLTFRCVVGPNAGDLLYLSAINPGYVTPIPPVSPFLVIPLGRVYATWTDGGVIYANVINVLESTSSVISKFVSPSAREVHVGNVLDAYPTIEAALAATAVLVPPPSASNPVVIIVHPGEYTPAGTLVIPSGINIIGVDGGTVGISGAFDIFSIAGNNCFFSNFHSITANAPTTSLFKCNDHSYINIYNVGQWRSGSNIQRYIDQSGGSWTQLSMSNCLIDSQSVSASPCTFDSIAARYVDVEIDDCFADNWFGGSCFSINMCQDFRFFKSKIRVSPGGTGIVVTGAGAWIEMQDIASVKGDGGYGPLLNAGAGTSARWAFCDGTYGGSGTITVIGGSTTPGPPGPVGPQGPGGPAVGLTTAYDIDLSTLTPASYATDGIKTIDGRAAWRLVNSANGQLIALNDGTHAGLYTRCSTFNSVNYGTTYNGPRWVVGLNDLCGVNPRDCVEQWVMFMFTQPHTPNADYEYGYLGIAAMPGADTDTNHTIPVFELAKGYSTGLNVRTMAEWQNTSTVTQSPAGTTNPLLTDDVYALRILANGVIEAYSGASTAGAWPAVSSLRYVGRALYFPQSQGYVASTPALAQDFQWAAVLSISQSNTVGACDLLLQKIQVLYR